MESENAKLREELKAMEVENDKLRENVKQLKLQVEKLEELHTSKQEDASCPSQQKEKVITSSKMIRKVASKNAKQSCVNLRNEGHFANGIYLVASDDPKELKKIQAISCEFTAADNSNKLNCIKKICISCYL